MRGLSQRKQALFGLPLFLLLCILTAPAATAAQIVSTTARGVASVANLGGFGIVPAGTQPAALADDLAPVQLFEISKPAGQSVTIGRMFTSCTCIILESDQRTFGPGERAVLRMRNVQATPPGGQSYALYVQITAPVSVTLRYDTYVQSSQFVPAADGAPPTRGNIVADGVLASDASLAAGTVLDVYVPKAENYIPDTSEYTLRKRAETESPREEAAKKETPKQTAALKTKTTGPAEPASGLSTLAAKPPEPPKREAPTIPVELRNTIDAAITQAERNLAVNPGTADFSEEGLAGRTASREARLSPDLKTDQAASYQTEARQIARDILNPGQTVARQTATKDSDDLWRTPQPRGRVRSTASLSTPPPASTPERRVPATAARSSSAAGMRVGRTTGAGSSTAETAVQKLEAQGQSVVDSLAGSSSGTTTASSGTRRSITDTIRSNEASVAERAREAALEAGKGVTGVLQSPAAESAGQALEALRTANRP